MCQNCVKVLCHTTVTPVFWHQCFETFWNKVMVSIFLTKHDFRYQPTVKVSIAVTCTWKAVQAVVVRNRWNVGSLSYLTLYYTPSNPMSLLRLWQLHLFLGWRWWVGQIGKGTQWCRTRRKHWNSVTPMLLRVTIILIYLWLPERLIILWPIQKKILKGTFLTPFNIGVIAPICTCLMHLQILYVCLSLSWYHILIP